MWVGGCVPFPFQPHSCMHAHTCSVYDREQPWTYPSVYLGMREEQSLQEACSSCLQPGQQQSRGRKRRAVHITAARLVNAVCNGLPQDLTDIADSGDEWPKIQVIHVCCQCRCVNPRHLLWGNNKLNASRNRNNVYQTALDALGDERIDITGMSGSWRTKVQAGNVVGQVANATSIVRSGQLTIQ